MHIFSFFRTLITVIVLLGGGWLNTVEPIRDLDVVMDIAEYLKGKSDRNYVMFMFGIYTGLRISDILKFRVRDVRDKDAVYIREKKTGKEKRFPINAELKPVIKDYVYGKDDYEYLFKSPRGNRPITRQQAYNILSEAGRQFDIDKIGTHTLRKEYMSTLRSELEELKKTYNESVKSTKESIASSFSIFSDVSLTKTDDENGLVVNLQRQVDALQKWRTNLQVLRDRGASDEMMKEIEGLGVNSAGDVETLTKMNNEQWAEYKQLYSQKNAVAKMEAVTQNKDLKKSTDKKMKELEKTYKTKIAKLKKTYQKEMKSIGANVAKGFANGIEKGSNDVYKAIAKLTGQTVKQVKKNLGIHSPSRVMAELGAYTGLGFAQGLQRETQGLADIITGNLPTTVPQVNGKATSGLQKSSQLNLTIQMDGNVVGKAALNTVDMLQGAKVSLTRRGIANA